MTKLRPAETGDLFRLKFVDNGSLSPNGKFAAYTVIHVDPKAEKQYSAIWVVSIEDGNNRQLTSGTASDSNPQWSPDSKQIAFISTRDDNKAQIYLIPVDGGEAHQLTALKQGVGGDLAWSPDGKSLAFTAHPHAEARDPAKPYRVTRKVHRFNALGNLDDVVQSLFIVPSAGGDPRQVTNDELNYSSPAWSPDGKSLLCLVSCFPDSQKAFLDRLFVVDVVTGTKRDVLAEWGWVSAAAWTPDGKHIVFIGQPHGLPNGSKSDLWIVTTSGDLQFVVQVRLSTTLTMD